MSIRKNYSTNQEQLTDYLVSCLKKHENGLILSATGLGSSYILRKTLASLHHPSITLIDSPDSFRFAPLNLIDLPLESNLPYVEKYFQQKPIDTAIILVSNNPNLLSSKQFLSTSFSKKIYSVHYFGCRSQVDLYLMLDELANLTHLQKEKIWVLSGGWARLAKLFALHPELIKQDSSSLMADPAVNILVTSIFNQLKKTPTQIQILLNMLHPDGSYKSQVLSQIASKIANHSPSSILLLPNWNFSENGVKSKHKLTKSEYDIIKFCLLNEFVISREDISDLKWGEGKYDNFSDQAINMCISRLNQKLSHYSFQALPKHGYELRTK